MNVIRAAFPALCLVVVGCGTSQPPMTTSDPPAKLRLERILEFYRSYIHEKKAAPADEKALRDYITALPADRKQGFGMVDDLDQLFTSPRDNKKYVIRWKVKFSQSGDTEGIGWEADGQDGKRFVALSTGYVEEYPQEWFNELKKK